MTPIFGPGWGNYAIDGIVETTMPNTVSLLPQTPGWALLLLVVLVTSVHRLWLRRQRWLQNRYRREALTQLAELKARFKQGEQSVLRDLAPLLRATAIAATDDRSLAPLRGEAWANALAAMDPAAHPLLPVERLEQLAYEPMPHASPGDGEALFMAIEQWITQHHA